MAAAKYVGKSCGARAPAALWEAQNPGYLAATLGASHCARLLRVLLGGTALPRHTYLALWEVCHCSQSQSKSLRPGWLGCGGQTWQAVWRPCSSVYSRLSPMQRFLYWSQAPEIQKSLVHSEWAFFSCLAVFSCSNVNLHPFECVLTSSCFTNYLASHKLFNSCHLLILLSFIQ